MAITGGFPTLKDFKDFMATKLDSVEVIRQSLYDSAVYPAAGIAAITFFQQPVGTGTSSSPGNAGAVKTLHDTNMQAAGALPAPQGFWIQSVELDFQPGNSTGASWQIVPPVETTPTFSRAALGGPESDVTLFYSAGRLELTIGAKPYLQEAPLLYFPPKCRFELDAAVGGVVNATSVVVTKGRMKAGGRPYILDPGLALMSSQNFAVQISWPNVVTTLSTFPGRVMCKLDGWLFRPAQ